MAVLECRECGKEISTDAETCPHCGIKYPGKGFLNRPHLTGCYGCFLWIVLLGLGVFLYLLFNL